VLGSKTVLRARKVTISSLWSNAQKNTSADASQFESGRCDEHWLDAIAIWEKAFQSLDLRKVVDDYIGIGRVPREKVLVIDLSREEGSARLYEVTIGASNACVSLSWVM